MEQENQKIKKELDELITTYYNGSFARLVREYIHTSEITEEEKDALVDAMKQMKNITFSLHLYIYKHNNLFFNKQRTILFM